MVDCSNGNGSNVYGTTVYNATSNIATSNVQPVSLNDSMITYRQGIIYGTDNTGSFPSLVVLRMSDRDVSGLVNILSGTTFVTSQYITWGGTTVHSESLFHLYRQYGITT